MLAVLVVGLWLGQLHGRIKSRSYAPERQDKTPEEGHYTLEEYIDTMKLLAEFNTLDFGGYNATLKAFQMLPSTPEKIVEIGFGGGDFSILLAQQYPNSEVVGVDAHELSVRVARSRYEEHKAALGPLPNLRFEHRPVDAMVQEEDAFDVVTTTLVNHHIFPDEEFVNFLRYVRRVGKVAFIFNDLNRSFRCYTKTYFGLTLILLVGSNLLSPVVNALHSLRPSDSLEYIRRALVVFREDRAGINLAIPSGIESVERSFSQSELEALFRQAGYPEGALTCEEYAISCRIICYADLTK